MDSGRYNFVHVLQDIQTLNNAPMKGELEITAISLHAYPYVAKNYALTACGCSMGDNYGPMMVAKRPFTRGAEGQEHRDPGTMTTAFLAASLALGKGFRNVVKPFDQILQYVKAEQPTPGLIIHEGQLTYKQGLVCCLDLGKWWMERTGLPLPLGGNVIRRNLGMETDPGNHGHFEAVDPVFAGPPEEAVTYALRFGRDMNAELADQFVGMYVNNWTLDYGSRGRDAINRLLDEALRHRHGAQVHAGRIHRITNSIGVRDRSTAPAS